MWLVFYNFMMIIKYLKDKITFTCIYCHYVVPEYSAYMIMYKRGGWGGGGGGGVILKIAWLAYNIVHCMVSKHNVYIYIYIYVMLKKIKQKTELFSRPSQAHLIEQTSIFVVLNESGTIQKVKTYSKSVQVPILSIYIYILLVWSQKW